MKPLLLLLLEASGRLTPRHTMSLTLICRTGSADRSDSYSNTDWSTEHQKRWKSAGIRTRPARPDQSASASVS